MNCEQNVEYPNVKPIGTYSNRGPGSSVGIVTDYGLDGSGSNPGGDEILRPYRQALERTQPPVKWVQSSPYTHIPPPGDPS